METILCLHHCSHARNVAQKLKLDLFLGEVLRKCRRIKRRQWKTRGLSFGLWIQARERRENEETTTRTETTTIEVIRLRETKTKTLEMGKVLKRMTWVLNWVKRVNQDKLHTVQSVRANKESREIEEEIVFQSQTRWKISNHKCSWGGRKEGKKEKAFLPFCSLAWVHEE